MKACRDSPPEMTRAICITRADMILTANGELSRLSTYYVASLPSCGGKIGGTVRNEFFAPKFPARELIDHQAFKCIRDRIDIVKPS